MSTMSSGVFSMGSGSPLHVQTRCMPASRPRNYVQMENSFPLFSFGCEGSSAGQFSRPWGICCDLTGRILVADRSNNRIQVFTPDGGFLMMFGRGGSRPSELNRPAGISVNSSNEIVVADKDNHRVQIFTEKGTFVRCFGSSGRQIGSFNYPWDVACNSRDDIAVSDTRNHRVQLFSKTGQFLRKCTFELNPMNKNYSFSPRGLVFLKNDRLVVTDFNGHHVAFLNINKQFVEIISFGSEGTPPGFFIRPQGVCLDGFGNLLVADSRCNRFQVIDPKDMRILGVVNGMQGMDRPCDLCVGRDGRIYVVDFGNNCVRVF